MLHREIERIISNFRETIHIASNVISTHPELQQCVSSDALDATGVKGILTLNFPTLNVIAHIFGTPPIDLATNTESRSQNLLDRALKLLRQGLEPHRPCNVDDLIECDRLGVLDVLLLLSVPGRFFESFDDE